MSNHLNFLGTSIWVPNHDASEWEQGGEPEKLYRPIVIAAYSSAYLPIGLILYGLNIFRRGDRWKGKLIIYLSGLFLILSIVVSNSTQAQLYYFFSPLIAAHLYSLERSYFKRAIREGWQPARWWIPLFFWAFIIFLSLLS
ncbi:MAG: hypothetical protein AAGE59_11980 [Cyanobacteria bacterium P01_F01_bin.86]